MVQQQTVSTGAQRNGWPADEWSDVIVRAMKLGGIDRLYFVSGSEISFYQEATIKAKMRGWPAPQLVTMIHEGAALNAALGDSMVTGQPAGTAVHVDVGTLNYGAGIHTAWRGGYPVLMTAGTGPRAYPGSMPGAREGGVQWVQEPRDQGEIVRQYTKLDHRMEHQDNPGLMISRLLQVAMSEPKGPVYLAVPQETARLPISGNPAFPTRDQLGVARPVWPDPADARQIAKWLIEASNPCIYTAQSGRNPESVEELTRLADLLAVPVVDTNRVNALNFPTSHPLYGTGPSPKDADVVLVFEAPVPYTPSRDEPNPSAKVVWVDPDPVQSRYKTMEFRADLWLPTTTASAARAIYEAATGQLSASDRSRMADRRERLAAKKREMAKAEEEKALALAKQYPIHPRWVAYQACKVLKSDTIVLDDSVSAAGFVRAYHGRDLPGTYFKSGGSSGGWGSGGAFGAKMAMPDRDVMLFSGDGYLPFGSPLAGLWAASHYKAPFLAVIFVNKSYSTGTTGLRRAYPEGVAVESANYDGGIFDPPPNFAKLAEAGNGFGVSISAPEDLEPALRQAMTEVYNGSPAIVAVDLPIPIHEPQSSGGGG